MSGLIAGLAGAGGAANTAGQYYQNAAGQIVDATGSPAAQTFGRLQLAAERPAFQSSNDALSAQLAAQGLGGSGAGRALGGNLAATQSGQEAGALAPLYSQALGQYGNIIGQEPGAQVSAYQNAIDNFYQAINDASSLAAGMPTSGGGQPGFSQAATGGYDNTYANYASSAPSGAYTGPALPFGGGPSDNPYGY